MKRVLGAVASSTVGGGEVYLRNLRRDYSRTGGVYQVAGTLPAGFPVDRELDIGPKWSKAEATRSLLMAGTERVRYLGAIREWKPDVLHAQYKREQILLSRAVSEVGSVIWTEHGPFPTGMYGRGLAYAYRRAAESVEKIICVSESVAISLERDVGIPPDKLVVVPNEVPPILFSEAVRASTRAALGFEQADIVVLTVGRVEHHKGIDRVLASAGSGRAMKSLVVGDGSELERLRIEYAGNPNVVFLGYQHDPSSFYSAADVFVLGSRASAREGTPLSMLEAVTNGLSVVVTSDSGVKKPDTVDLPFLAEADPSQLGGAICRVDRLNTAERIVCGHLGQSRYANWIARHKRIFDPLGG